jgi:hypothetical protein
MQDRFRVSRAPALIVRGVVRRGPHPSFALLLALGAAACSSEYPIGGLSEQSLPIGWAPGDNQTGSADSQLEALLSPADVTLAGGAEILQNPAGVGDVDGDGYGDFAVTGFDEATFIAYVHLRYGGPEPVDAEGQFALAESGARLAFEENSPGIESISAAGDVNGDGFADLLVTAMVCESLFPSGGAYLLYGGSDRLEGVVRIGDVSAHLKLPIERVGRENCGTPSHAPLGLGDIDGDGLGDFMLVHYRSDYTDAAQIDPTHTMGYVFYGREEPLTSDMTWFDADATISAEQFFMPVPLGDVTADGRADFALGSELAGYYWVPGATQRLTGDMDAGAAFATLGCADEDCSVPPVARAGDVDGDGIDDVLAYETWQRAHLFYGTPGLLDDGVLDFQNAAASFIDELALPRELLLTPAGDRDGDGKGDLLSLFYSDAEGVHTDVAFVSGSSARLDGAQTLPIQAAIASRPGGLPFELVIEEQNQTFQQDRVVFSATDAGDINGDGADDLLTTSMHMAGANASARRFDFPQIHIHYGIPGRSASAAPIR